MGMYLNFLNESKRSSTKDVSVKKVLNEDIKNIWIVQIEKGSIGDSGKNAIGKLKDYLLELGINWVEPKQIQVSNYSDKITIEVDSKVEAGNLIKALNRVLPEASELWKKTNRVGYNAFATEMRKSDSDKLYDSPTGREILN